MMDLKSLDTAALARIEGRIEEKIREAQSRELVSYDYEKVFWNSVWGIGIYLLTWGLVQFSDLVISFLNPALENYSMIVRYVEGDLKNAPLVGLPIDLANQIAQYRLDTNLWESFKEIMTQIEAERPVFKIVNQVDAVVDRYGPIVPYAIIGLNLVTEQRRVKRLREDLGLSIR